MSFKLEEEFKKNPTERERALLVQQYTEDTRTIMERVTKKPQFNKGGCWRLSTTRESDGSNRVKFCGIGREDVFERALTHVCKDVKSVQRVVIAAGLFSMLNDIEAAKKKADAQLLIDRAREILDLQLEGLAKLEKAINEEE